LNVDHRLRLILGTSIEVEIVLDWYADKVGDRVLRLLGQLTFRCTFLASLSFERLALSSPRHTAEAVNADKDSNTDKVRVLDMNMNINNFLIICIKHGGQLS
jgi:hypothetical protein